MMGFYRWLFRLTVKLGIYGVWSKRYQEAYESFRRMYLIDEDLDVAQVDALFRLLTWKKDTWREMWDAVHSPYYTQWVLDKIIQDNGSSLAMVMADKNNMIEKLKGMEKIGQPSGSMDCDDYAVAAAHMLEPKYNARFMIVCLVNGTLRLGGHAVCVYDTGNGELGHVSNWGSFGEFKSDQHIADWVAKSAGKPLVGYTVLRKENLYRKK